MAAFLLDANVLIALAWPQHISHARAERWFARHAQSGWSTCPFTQAAFVRILSNPAFSRSALTPKNALKLLELNLGHPKHQFWPDSIPVGDAVKEVEARLSGHLQITDAYLVGLALRHRGKLATMDGGVVALVGARGAGGVELLPR